MSELKFYQKGLELSCRAAAEGTVLLKNDNNVLPLDKSEKVALFGRNQCDTYKGCGGAADLWAVKVQPFADGMEKVGNVYEPMLKKYRATSKANYDRLIFTNILCPKCALPTPKLQKPPRCAILR